MCHRAIRHIHEVVEMLFSYTQCIYAKAFNLTQRWAGRNPEVARGSHPPLAAKYLLLFVPPRVISNDFNRDVHTGLPGGLQVSFRPSHDWVWLVANKIFYSYFIKRHDSHTAASFAEVKQPGLKQLLTLILDSFWKKKREAAWALQADSAMC